MAISNSIGSMDSIPYTSWKGVNLVDDFMMVWYAHRVENTMWFQLVL